MTLLLLFVFICLYYLFDILSNNACKYYNMLYMKKKYTFQLYNIQIFNQSLS